MLATGTSNSDAGESKMRREHEQTVEEIAQCNFAMALDQADEYPTLDDAFDSYRTNAVDSIQADGYSAEDAERGMMIFDCLEQNYRAIVTHATLIWRF